MPASDVEVRPVPVTNDGGDHERFAHYVKGGKNAVTEAYVMGTPVTALCGKVWVPSRNPKMFPVCPECQEKVDEMINKEN